LRADLHAPLARLQPTARPITDVVLEQKLRRTRADGSCYLTVLLMASGWVSAGWLLLLLLLLLLLYGT
jgi:hypothetical protein